jgi:hypothetical protein
MKPDSADPQNWTCVGDGELSDAAVSALASLLIDAVEAEDSTESN